MKLQFIIVEARSTVGFWLGNQRLNADDSPLSTINWMVLEPVVVPSSLIVFVGILPTFVDEVPPFTGLACTLLILIIL